MTNNSKTYSTRSNAKAGIMAFRKAHPDMTDVEFSVIPDGKRFGVEAMLPSGATDTLRTRLEELGFRTARGPEGPAEEVEALA